MNNLFSQDKETYTDLAVKLRNLNLQSHQNATLAQYVIPDDDNDKKIERFMKKARRQFKAQGLHDFSSLPFYRQKQMIRRNPLFTKIITQMPKGGLLHIHSTAGLSLQMMIAMMADWNLHSTDKNKIYIQTREVPDAEHIYPTGTLCYKYQLTDILAPFFIEFNRFIEQENAIAQLYEWLSFETASIEDIPYIWDQFNLIFSRTASLFRNRDFYRKYHIMLFEECIADKIDYIELRCGFETFDLPDAHMQTSDMTPDFSLQHRRSVLGYTAANALYFSEMSANLNVNSPDTAFLDAINDAIETINSGADRLKVRVILNANRTLNPAIPAEAQKIREKIDTAISIINPFNSRSTFKTYRNMVIGFDFVGEEDRGQPTSSYIDILYEPSKSILAGGKPRIQCVNLFLHDGESNWSDNDNIFDAVLLSKHRIGHGINLNKYPALIECMNHHSDGLLEPVLEICPISNQLLRYFPDLRNHSLTELKKWGINCVICNDDPQIFGNPGLSFDFWQVYMNMDVTLNELKQFIFLTYFYKNYGYQNTGSSEPEDAALTAAAEEFAQKWSAFRQTVVQTILAG